MPDPVPADRICAKTDEEAQDRFLTFLRQSLRALSSRAVWIVIPPLQTGARMAVRTEPRTMRLKTADPARSWYLRSTIQFNLGPHPDYPGERKVFTENYAHTLSEDESLHPEFCSWQWDADSRHDAHVHVHRGAPAFGSLGKLHIPTARVTFEQVARFAIDDLGALPNRELGNTEQERLNQALSLLGESHRRVQKYGRGRG